MGQSCSQATTATSEPTPLVSEEASGVSAAADDAYADASTWRTAVLDAYEELRNSNANHFPASQAIIHEQTEAVLDGARKRSHPGATAQGAPAHHAATAHHPYAHWPTEPDATMPRRARPRLACCSDGGSGAAPRALHAAPPPSLPPPVPAVQLPPLPSAPLMPLPLSATRQATESSDEPSPAGDIGRLEAALTDLYESQDRPSLQLQEALRMTTDSASGRASTRPSIERGASTRPSIERGGGTPVRAGMPSPHGRPPLERAPTEESEDRPRLVRSPSRETDGAITSAPVDGSGIPHFDPSGNPSVDEDPVEGDGGDADRDGAHGDAKEGGGGAGGGGKGSGDGEVSIVDSGSDDGGPNDSRDLPPPPPSYAPPPPAGVHQIPYAHAHPHAAAPHHQYHQYPPSAQPPPPSSAPPPGAAHAAMFAPPPPQGYSPFAEDAHGPPPPAAAAAPLPHAGWVHQQPLHPMYAHGAPAQIHPWPVLPHPSDEGGAHGAAAGPEGEKEQTRKPWLASEDQTIVDSVREMGFKWRLIAAMLPGRSDDAVRNRWNRLQEAIRDGTSRLLGGGSGGGGGDGAPMEKVKAGYKCSKCGQPKRNHQCTYQPGSALASQGGRRRRSGKIGSSPWRMVRSCA